MRGRAAACEDVLNRLIIPLAPSREGARREIRGKTAGEIFPNALLCSARKHEQGSRNMLGACLRTRRGNRGKAHAGRLQGARGTFWQDRRVELPDRPFARSTKTRAHAACGAQHHRSSINAAAPMLHRKHPSQNLRRGHRTGSSSRTRPSCCRKTQASDQDQAQKSAPGPSRGQARHLPPRISSKWHLSIAGGRFGMHSIFRSDPCPANLQKALLLRCAPSRKTCHFGEIRGKLWRHFKDVSWRFREASSLTCVYAIKAFFRRTCIRCLLQFSRTARDGRRDPWIRGLSARSSCAQTAVPIPVPSPMTPLTTLTTLPVPRPSAEAPSQSLP